MADIAQLLSTLVLGLLAGSLLTEAIILVPYWRRMDPAAFFQLHGTMGPHLFRFFAPLTVVAVGLAIAVAVTKGAANAAWLVAAGLCLAALAIFFIYFRAANNRFATHDMPDASLAGELGKWATWHWLRTLIIIAALGASILGHTLEAGI